MKMRSNRYNSTLDYRLHIVRISRKAMKAVAIILPFFIIIAIIFAIGLIIH